MIQNILKVPTILFPYSSISLEKWAVVACDQYTSEPEYWNDVASITANSPSTLELIYPEVFLEESKENRKKRIENINQSMKEYQKSYLEEKSGFILVDRKTSHQPSRKGLMILVDLEYYSYEKGSQTPIRATEGTVLDRLPPRIEVRKNATLELPHIMFLIDDPSKTVIEPLFDNINDENLLYDFDLMKNGGHIKGHLLNDAKSIEHIYSTLNNLASKDIFKEKYDVNDEKGVLLFAVGDGNHSLATAKSIWETTKEALSAEEKKDHYARYALVELVNVFDEGVEFEPIHRVIFDADDFFSFVDGLKNIEISNSPKEDYQSVEFVTKNRKGFLIFKNPSSNLEVGSLQEIIDNYLETNKKAKVDYIHGMDTTLKFANSDGNIGFILPSMKKEDLFKTVIYDGVLPRKTFSMGEAEEKRFYLECRKIK